MKGHEEIKWENLFAIYIVTYETPNSVPTLHTRIEPMQVVGVRYGFCMEINLKGAQQSLTIYYAHVSWKSGLVE